MHIGRRGNQRAHDQPMARAGEMTKTLTINKAKKLAPSEFCVCKKSCITNRLFNQNIAASVVRARPLCSTMCSSENFSSALSSLNLIKNFLTCGLTSRTPASNLRYSRMPCMTRRTDTRNRCSGVKSKSSNENWCLTCDETSSSSGSINCMSTTGSLPNDEREGALEGMECDFLGGGSKARAILVRGCGKTTCASSGC